MTEGVKLNDEPGEVKIELISPAVILIVFFKPRLTYVSFTRFQLIQRKYLFIQSFFQTFRKTLCPFCGIRFFLHITIYWRIVAIRQSEIRKKYP